MGDHEALVSEFAKMPPEHVAMILEAAKQVLLSAQPPGGAPPAGGAPAPAQEPSAPPAGLAQSEASAHKGIGDKSDAVPAGPANQKPSEGHAGFPGTANSGASPLHPASESGNMHAKLASPPDHIENHLSGPTAKSASDGGPMNPGRETGSTHVPDSSMLRTTSQAPEGGLGGVARKSEVDAELAELRKANVELNAKLERLIGVTTDLVERPVRKAITGMEYVSIRGTPGQDPAANAPKRMTQQEITNRLSEKVRDPRLAKADRELINDFYDHRVDVSKIEHLLK